MKSNKFIYVTGDLEWVFPFRAGDLVKIKDWGGIYECFTKANDALLGEDNKPYYCYELGSKSPRNRLFKIINFGLHPSGRSIVFAIKDIENKTAVMSSTALEPFLTYPLKVGESKIVKLNKI